MVDLQIKLANIAYRFVSPFPFDESKFLKILQEDGLFDKRDEPLAFGQAQIGMVEAFYSESGNTFINFQPQEGIFGLKSKDYDECKELFGALQKAIFTDLDVNKEDINFLEFSANGLFRPNEKPIDLIGSKFTTGSELNLGEDKLKIFGARYYSASEEIDRNVKDIRFWTDIRIEPFILNPAFVNWEITCRNSEEKTLNYWINLGQFINEIIEPKME